MIKFRNMTAVFIIYEGKMLMLNRKGSRLADVNGTWVGIGGHMEPVEIDDPEAAALREVYEEIGIRSDELENMKLRYVTLRLKDGEIRQNHYYFAELAEGASVPETCTEGILEWVPIEDVIQRDMPYSAKYMMQHYMKTGRYDEKLYVGAAQKGCVTFTELERLQ